jgi:membrane associated rhomboid family serine protease
MIPLKDDVPSRRFPAATVGIIATNILVFLWEIGSGDPHTFERIIQGYGAVPWQIVHLSGHHGPFPIPFTIISSMFLHGGVAHIAGNMLFLWVFGHSVESAMGAFRYFAFYILSGVVAALTQVAMMPASHVPMVGASGAIAGVLGAYFMLFPRARVLTLVPIFVFVRLIYLPAVLFLGLWFLMQLFAVPQALGGGPGVAFLAHIGGFVVGLLLGRAFAPARRQPSYPVIRTQRGYLN